MELNALTRWESIGKDLYSQGALGHEIERIKRFSRQLAQARANQRKLHKNIRTNVEHDQSVHRSIDEGKEEDDELFMSPTESPVQTPTSSPTQRVPLSSSAALYAIESTGELNDHLINQPLDQPISDEHIELEPVKDAIPVHHARILFFIYRAVRRFGKGFLVGYLGKFAFGLVSVLLKSKGSINQILMGARKVAGRSDVRGFGLFLGGFLCLFESLMRVLKRMKGVSFNETISQALKSRTFRVVVAAAISSLSFLFIPADYRVSLSMFFFVRALEIMGNYGVERINQSSNQSIKHSKLASALVHHSDTLLMGFASSAVIWCWLFRRDCLDDSYGHFVDMQGGKPRFIVDAYKVAHYGNAALFDNQQLISRVQAYRKSNNQSPLSPTSSTLHCDVLHPGQSHYSHLLTFLRQGMLRALPIYGPVFTLPVLLFKQADLMKRPLPLVLATVKAIMRSSLFLSSYCAACWFTACHLNMFGSHGPVNGILAGFAGGLMVGIEKKSRRIELALYVLAQALPASWRLLVSKFNLRNIPHAELPIFVFSMSVIMSAFVIRPHLLRRSYLSLLMFFFGGGGRAAQFHTKKQLKGDVLKQYVSNQRSQSSNQSINQSNNQSVPSIEALSNQSTNETASGSKPGVTFSVSLDTIPSTPSSDSSNINSSPSL